MDDKTRQKLHKLEGLMRQRDEIEKEIASIINPGKAGSLPSSFILNDEVLKLLQENGVSGLDKRAILRLLQDKYPAYGINRTQVASTLAYLKNAKHQVEIVRRGVYRSI